MASKAKQADQQPDPNAGRDPVGPEGGSVQVNENGVRTSGGDSVTPGTVVTTDEVRRTDDEALTSTSGVIADNQPEPKAWDADKGEETSVSKATGSK